MSAAALQPEEIVLELPEKIVDALFVREGRYRILHGGRGGAKSWGVARALLAKGRERRRRILCAREIQRSIADSVHKLLRDQIAAMNLSRFYRVTDNAIRGQNGTEFIFAGLRTNVDQIKSMEGIDVAWVEEAHSVSDESWRLLIPTIRKAGSEIWVTFNPHSATDAVWQRFVLNPPPSAVVVKIGWQDNPWLPDELRAEKDYDYAVDPEQAEHTWGGALAPPLTGRVYKGFRRATHEKAVGYERSLELHLWCDFNVHAMRWLLVQLHGKEIRALDQIATGRDMDTSVASTEAVRRIVAIGHKGTVVVTGDASGNARRSSSTKTDYLIIRETLEAAGFEVIIRVPPANPAVKERVRVVNYVLEGRDGRLVRIDPKCKELIEDFESVGWKDGVEDIDKSDPLRTHASDAFGYGAYLCARPVLNSDAVVVASPSPAAQQHHARVREARQW